jgi:hypothetical protein
VARGDTEAKLHQLEELRGDPTSEGTREALARALRDRSNVVVAKAARLIGELGLNGLAPELASTFQRLSGATPTPAKADPQCWAKNAIAEALHRLDWDDAAVFLLGLSHVQLEPVWGGVTDTAVPLRGVCALGLVNCRSLASQEILLHLVERLADPEATVRTRAARAIAALGNHAGIAVLRLKAVQGDAESAVTGECFLGLLEMDPQGSLDFVGRFLRGSGSVAGEAAAALGACRLPEGFALLQQAWNDCVDPELRAQMLLAMGTSRVEPAIAFLLEIVQQGRLRDARQALTALAPNRFTGSIAEAVEQAVSRRGEPEVKAEYARHFGS